MEQGCEHDPGTKLNNRSTRPAQKYRAQRTEKDSCWFLWSNFCFNGTFSLIQEWRCGYIINGVLCLKPGSRSGLQASSNTDVGPTVCDPFSCGQGPCRWRPFPRANKANHGQERCYENKCLYLMSKAEQNIITGLQKLL